MYHNASHDLFYLKTEFAKIVVGKGRSIDGFHGNWRNYLIYVYYQYITCNFLIVNAGNVRLQMEAFVQHRYANYMQIG